MKLVEGDVQANGIKLHYYCSGGDKPALVLAHGITNNGLCWHSLAEDLEDLCDVVMYDARGHGFSDAPGGYTRFNHADDLYGLIQALDLDKPIVLGHSMGAMTSLLFGGTYPDTPRAMILEDPPLQDSMTEEDQASNRERLDKIISGFMASQEKPREELVASRQKQVPPWSVEEIDAWADSKYHTDLKVFELITHTGPIWEDVIRKISCPVLVHAGDFEAGAMLADDGIQKLREWISRIEVAHFAGAGHGIRKAQPEKYTQAVRAFLNTL